ncbi:uncharacterized protein PAE49_008231 [Odontesthes bonariensis]
MGQVFQKELCNNSLKFEKELERLRDKYSKAQHYDGWKEVDINSIRPDTLERYVRLSRKQLEQIESELLRSKQESCLASWGAGSNLLLLPPLLTGDISSLEHWPAPHTCCDWTTCSCCSSYEDKSCSYLDMEFSPFPVCRVLPCAEECPLGPSVHDVLKRKVWEEVCGGRPQRSEAGSAELLCAAQRCSEDAAARLEKTQQYWELGEGRRPLSPAEMSQPVHS